jgi:flavin-dependent dehydrogenase
MYQIAIIGAGPAGLSAAARAAERDRRAHKDGKGSTPSYVLLEAFNAHAKTIQRYQKGKHVMAEPGFLDLRSDMQFSAGSREKILAGWGEGLQKGGVNVRYGAEVRKVTGNKHAFNLQLTTGEVVQAAHVVLAIGLEGNPRKLGAPGEDLERVQYQLDDPKEFRDETIWSSAPATRRSRTRWRWPSRTTCGSSTAARNSAVPRSQTSTPWSRHCRPAAPPQLPLRSEHQECCARRAPVRRR